MEGITKRQAELFQHLANGLSMREAAAKMFITSQTAVHHAALLKERIGCKHTAHAMAVLIRRGTIK